MGPHDVEKKEKTESNYVRPGQWKRLALERRIDVSARYRAVSKNKHHGLHTSSIDQSLRELAREFELDRQKAMYPSPKPCLGCVGAVSFILPVCHSHIYAVSVALQAL